jgi:GDPmannose 4,6-dehydratase
MFNHESPRRGEEFVTRKVTLAAARIANGFQDELMLGRLDPVRDWGWAPDYMRALPLIAKQDKPDDFVLATGETHSVSELCEKAFAAAGMDWTDYVRSVPELYRPSEVWTLCGNPSKAKRQLGWKPKVSFDELVRNMVSEDMRSCA